MTPRRIMSARQTFDDEYVYGSLRAGASGFLVIIAYESGLVSPPRP